MSPLPAQRGNSPTNNSCQMTDRVPSKITHLSEFTMKSMYRSVVMCALLAASTPMLAAAQDVSNASLISRIEQLEKTNANLERRLSEVEKLLKKTPASAQTVAGSSKSRDVANWRRLRVGMSMDEVRELLGEPERIEGGGVATWHWTDANVVFLSEKVAQWSEPRR